MKKCANCQNYVTDIAKFCPSCGIAQHAVHIEGFSMAHSHLERMIYSYPERILPSKLPKKLALIVLWELIFAIDYVIAVFLEKTNEHFLVIALLCTFFGLICVNTAFCAQQLGNFFPKLSFFIDADEQDLQRWYQKHLNESYAGAMPLVAGAITALFAIGSLWNILEEFSAGKHLLFYYRVIYLSIGFVACGIGIWALLRVMLIAHEIPKFAIKIAVYQNPETSVLALGALFWRMSMAILAPYAVVVMAVMASPYRASWIALLWLGAAAVLVLAFFILPQIGVHDIMAREKRKRLELFSSHLEKALEDSLRVPSSENMMRVKELFELHQHLHNMSEWPFNPQTLWQLLSALIIPIILAILQIVFASSN